MKSGKTIYGLDILKFIMAVLIVDCHVGGSRIAPPYLYNYFVEPLESLTVPTFFVISAFFFFRKARYSTEKATVLVHFIKRIALLYAFWAIVWSPIVFMQKDYFHPISPLAPLFLFREFLFGEVFDASWFLGALLVGIPIVFMLSKYLRDSYLIIVIFFIHFFLFFLHMYPFNGLLIQDWYSTYVGSKGINLSFPAGLIWITIGYVLSNQTICNKMECIEEKWTWICFVGAFIVMIIFPFIGRMICVSALFIAAYTWKLPEYPKLFRRFRTYSILFYVIHDCFKKIPKQLFGWENGPVLFVVTIVFCFLASDVIMRMKEVKGFGWLRYAY